MVYTIIDLFVYIPYTPETMRDPQKYQLDLPRDRRPSPIKLEEMLHPGVKKTWPKCTDIRSVDPIDGIKAVVIHATAGSTSPGAVSVMIAGRASFHWLVPSEIEKQHGRYVWACVPEDLAAWHVRKDKSHPDVYAGKNNVNHWSLGIEVVNTQKDSDHFSEWQIYMTALIVQYCWAKYPKLEYIVSHAKLDPERRTDPGVNFPWERFKDLVLNI